MADRQELQSIEPSLLVAANISPSGSLSADAAGEQLEPPSPSQAGATPAGRRVKPLRKVDEPGPPITRERSGASNQRVSPPTESQSTPLLPAQRISRRNTSAQSATLITEKNPGASELSDAEQVLPPSTTSRISGKGKASQVKGTKAGVETLKVVRANPKRASGKPAVAGRAKEASQIEATSGYRDVTRKKAIQAIQRGGVKPMSTLYEKRGRATKSTGKGKGKAVPEEEEEEEDSDSVYAA